MGMQMLNIIDLDDLELAIDVSDLVIAPIMSIMSHFNERDMTYLTDAIMMLWQLIADGHIEIVGQSVFDEFKDILNDQSSREQMICDRILNNQYLVAINMLKTLIRERYDKNYK